VEKKNNSLLAGKTVLAVDDEPDVLEALEDVLDQVLLDKASDYETASAMIKAKQYDLTILDIMGVNGLELLEQAVGRGIPAVMLTAHAVSPESMIESKRKGALSFLPKEQMANLDQFLEELLAVSARGESTWELLVGKLGGFFDRRFGAGWIRWL